MSRLVQTKGAAPATPASNKSAIFIDTADFRAKQIDSNGVINTLTNDGMKNRSVLDNGSLMVQQRVATASTAIAGITTSTRAGVVADRWAVTASVATNVLWARVDSIGAPETDLLARYYGTITKSTALKKVMLSQYLVANQMAHLRNQKVRLSFKHNQKVGSAQVLRYGIVQLQSTGTVDAPPAFLSGAWSTSDGTDPAWSANTAAVTPESSPTPENGTVVGSWVETTTAATTWTRTSGVWTVPSNCKGFYVVIFTNTGGASTDSFGFAELQVTQGPEVVDFVQVPDEEVWLRCQQFYCKTFAATTVPVTNAGLNTGELKWAKVVAGATAGRSQWQFPWRMWKTPTTVTAYNPAAANAQVRDETNTVDCSATTFVGTTDRQTGITYTGNAATVAEGLMGVHITADAEIIV